MRRSGSRKPATASSLGSFLVLDEASEISERLEIRGDELVVGDLNPELLLQMGDELDHSERIDDAHPEEVVVRSERCHSAVADQLGQDELLQLSVDVH